MGRIVDDEVESRVLIAPGLFGQLMYPNGRAGYIESHTLGPVGA